jgi:TadE-like protein
MSRRGEGGQAAVEFALVMPLLIFMILGTLQLFLLGQARIAAQYAASRATRLGAMNHANCNAIIKPAIAVLMPAINAGYGRAPSVGTAYATEVRARLPNRYLPARDGGRTGPIVWVDRVRPLAANLNPATEEDLWNLPPPLGTMRVLEVRMVFWAPLKIPFANWVLMRMALAHWGLRDLNTANPLMPVRPDAQWTQQSLPPSARVGAELVMRYDSGEYVFPIEATYAMRMMSPPRFTRQNCQ